MNATNQIPQYVRMHQVGAAPMTKGDFHSRVKNDPQMLSAEEAGQEGYVVHYPDGYVSWCPKAQFEAAGRPIDGMTFGMAIEAMKRGRRVARKGWNGKGMYLWLLPAAEVKKEWCKDPRLIEAMGERDTLPCLGAIRMFTATREVLTGWLASQTDMLAEDWMVLADNSDPDQVAP